MAEIRCCLFLFCRLYGVEYFYSISYEWYSPIGFTIVFVVGGLLSLIFGKLSNNMMAKVTCVNSNYSQLRQTFIVIIV